MQRLRTLLVTKTNITEMVEMKILLILLRLEIHKSDRDVLAPIKSKPVENLALKIVLLIQLPLQLYLRFKSLRAVKACVTTSKFKGLRTSADFSNGSISITMEKLQIMSLSKVLPGNKGYDSAYLIAIKGGKKISTYKMQLNKPSSYFLLLNL
jgi:hypothetical protein